MNIIDVSLERRDEFQYNFVKSIMESFSNSQNISVSCITVNFMLTKFTASIVTAGSTIARAFIAFFVEWNVCLVDLISNYFSGLVRIGFAH